MAKRNRVVKARTAAQVSRRKIASEDLQVRQRRYGSGGKYRVYGTDQEESIDESY